MLCQNGLWPKCAEKEKFTKWSFLEELRLRNLKWSETQIPLEQKLPSCPDEQIFTETREFKYDLLAKRLRELAFLNPGVKIVLKDDKDNRRRIFV